MVVVCKPILVFSLSLDQAEQLNYIWEQIIQPSSTYLTKLFLELSAFRISLVNILRNQGGGGGVQKDYTITGGRGYLKGPKKGLRN